eukprot:429950_1
MECRLWDVVVRICVDRMIDLLWCRDGENTLDTFMLEISGICVYISMANGHKPSSMTYFSTLCSILGITSLPIATKKGMLMCLMKHIMYLDEILYCEEILHCDAIPVLYCDIYEILPVVTHDICECDIVL